MGRLSGKTALITAAGQGIGRASAIAMAREGAAVIATDINPDALAELAALGLQTFVLDVRNPASIAAAIVAAGSVNVLFNCAGFVASGSILDCDEDQWAFSLDLNMTAMYRMCRAFLPGMLVQGSGSIINMASVASSVRLLLIEGAQPGMPLAALIPMDESCPDRIAALIRLTQLLWDRPLIADTRLTAQRRRRLCRMLQAVDGHLAGATYRDIANAIYGPSRVATDSWKTSPCATARSRWSGTDAR